MKKIVLLTFTFLAFHTFLKAQNKPYFQQQADMTISATLDDKKHTLKGDVRIDYTNNSPDELTFIYLHLWANAYSGQESAFAQQHLRNGKTDFYFAPEKALGGFSDLRFTVNDAFSEVETDEKNPDIIKINLPKPLRSGEKITIQTPYTLKIPRSFSRLGRVGQSYQLTQWFPKPAVYDPRGWHPIPYLDQGEFYSEFGNYDVTITLPQNYVVGATGELQTESEKAFLDQKIAETKNTNIEQIKEKKEQKEAFPASSAEMKTIRFTAKNVHDFAFFADKRFLVQKGEVSLKSGKKINTYTMYLPNFAQTWQQSIEYVNRSVRHYSDLVGEYPYPQATAVQSALSAGAGMEYPMITVIGDEKDPKALDDVITHEVGHNWFYGILASNERDFAYLDEGFNSYYEYRYMAKNYGKNRYNDMLPNFISKGSRYGLTEIAHDFQYQNHRHQAVNTPSEQLSNINYGLSIYDKTALLLGMLEQQLGEQRFDALMQSYYEKWKFKHPQPEDFESHVRANVGDKNVDWLFRKLIPTTETPDYEMEELKAISETDYELTIENENGITSPLFISEMLGDSIVKTEIFEGFEGEKTIKVKRTNTLTTAFVIDAEHRTPETDRSNNYIKIANGSDKRPLKVRFLGGVDNSEKRNFYVSPLPAYNVYDGFMLGLTAYNSAVPIKDTRLTTSVLYGTKSGRLAGMLNLEHDLWAKNNKITFGISAKKFTKDRVLERDLGYTRFVPSVTWQLPKTPQSPMTQTVSLRHIAIATQGLDFENFTGVAFEVTNWSYITELAYQNEIKSALGNTFIRAAVEQQPYESAFGDKESYLKSTLDLRKDFVYNAKKKKISARLFIGAFLQNTRKNAGAVQDEYTRGSISLSGQCFNDYRFDDLFVARNRDVGFMSQQILDNYEGGFKYATGSSYAGVIGFSNTFATSLNLKADLPFSGILKPYLDLGYYDNNQPTGKDATFNDQFLYAGGVQINLGDFVLINLPLFNSKNLQSVLDQRNASESSGLKKYAKNITFSLNFQNFKAKNLIKRFVP